MELLSAGLCLAAVPGVLAVVGYLVLRVCGKLRVNHDGWNAGALEAGGRVWVPALRLFSFFQPLMRREAVLRGKLAGTRRETAVSEVVVELVVIV